MIEYMTNHEKGTIIYQINNVEITKYSLLHTVESMCEMHLFSYEGYRKAVKKYFHFSHLIPIYLSEEIQLISIKRYRDYDNNFINYVAIENYCEFQEGVNFIFEWKENLYKDVFI